MLSLLRLPWPPFSRERWIGNDETQMLEYAKRLRDLKVDYLHVVAGFGFPNPRDVPGPFPFDEIKMFFSSTRHLSRKAAVRSAVVNTVPAFLLRRLLNLGWKYEQGINLDYAETFKAVVGLPVIANGGFQKKDFIEEAIESERCDMVSMARALIANPDLLDVFGLVSTSRPMSARTATDAWAERSRARWVAMTRSVSLGQSDAGADLEMEPT